MATKPRVHGVKRRAKLEALAYGFELKEIFGAPAILAVSRGRGVSTEFRH
jgi:hypothetical protein